MRLVAAALAAAALLAAPASAGLVAERVSEENAGERLLGGPDAVGGVGDWFLANDVVEVIVDDPGRRHGTLTHGGTLVDAGRVGRRGRDQFARLFPLLNLDQRVVAGFDTMRAEVDPQGRFARLVVSSPGLASIPRGGPLARAFDLLVPETAAIEAVRIETEYRVEPGQPWVAIVTRLVNGGDETAPVFSYGDVWMRGGRGMRSFVGDTLAPGRSPGFRHQSFDRSDILASGEAMKAFTFVAMAGVQGFPEVAYALASPARVRRGLRSFGVTGVHVNLVAAFTSDPDWDRLGTLRMLRATRGSLAPGASWELERRLFVADGPDVAAVTNLLFPALGFADGTAGVEVRLATRERAVVHVLREDDGAPVTQLAFPRADGDAARAALPPGRYRLELRAGAGEPETGPVSVSVEPGAFVPVALRAPEPSALVFAPAFADGGPGRVEVRGVDGTPDPLFGAELLGFRVDGRRVGSATARRAIFFAGSPADPGRVPIPPGRYRLLATRGPEFSLAEAEVEVPAGADVRVPPLAPQRLLSLAGFLSADLHVHAQASDDSQMPDRERLASFVAEHVDVMVSTDHEHVADFGPAREALGVDGRIRVRTGVEVTSSAPSPAAPFTVGHVNAWPVERRPRAHRGGAPASTGMGLADLFAALRGEHGARVLQLNHALTADGELDEGAFLSHMGTEGRAFDPARPLGEAPNRVLLEPGADGRTRPLDFDAMEVMNGASFGQYRALREAWYALQRQGVRRAATGNSDTHGPNEVAAYPRSYVAVGAGQGDEAFDRAVREGRLFLTTGPLFTAFRAGEGGMGDLVAARDGAVSVRAVVEAAPWVPVDELRLLVDGEVVRRWPGAEPVGERASRLEVEATLPLRRDAFLTLEAGVPLDVDADAWRAARGGDYAAVVAPGFLPQALSNPIFVDADGDGRFTAPGLSRRPTGDAALAELLGVAAAVGGLALLWALARRRARGAGLR